MQTYVRCAARRWHPRLTPRARCAFFAPGTEERSRLMAIVDDTESQRRRRSRARPYREPRLAGTLCPRDDHGQNRLRLSVGGANFRLSVRSTRIRLPVAAIRGIGTDRVCRQNARTEREGEELTTTCRNRGTAAVRAKSRSPSGGGAAYSCRVPCWEFC